MTLLTLIEEGSYVRVLQVIQGGTDPDRSHLGVSPLSLAIECGDPDMVAILLDWKADPLKKHGLTRPSALQLAESISNDEKHPHHKAAREIVALIGDPDLVKARLKALEPVIQKMRDSDRRKAIIFSIVCAIIAACATVMYKTVAVNVPNEAGEL